MNMSKRWFLLIAPLAWLPLGSVCAGQLPGPVVSPQWLNEHLKDVVVLDVRDDLDSWTTEPEYEKDKKTGEPKLSATGGHIAGALALEFDKVRVSRTEDGKKIDKMLPDKAYVQELLQSAGVTKGRPVVITSPGEAADQVDEAARVYWTMKFYGADDLAILDGGNASWIAAGLPVSLERSVPARGDWQATAERHELLAEIPDVERAMKDKTQIVDARPLPQYLGVMSKKPAVMVPGHLEGARNYPTDLRTRPSGIALQFLKPEEYRTLYRIQGIDPVAPTIVYCNTGHMAAGSWFVQSELLGTRNVRLYDGSMHEWTSFGRPVVGLGG